MPVEAVPMGRRHRISATRLTLEAWYLGIVTAVAAYGMTDRAHPTVLVALAPLALPFGVVAGATTPPPFGRGRCPWTVRSGGHLSSREHDGRAGAERERRIGAPGG